MEKPDALTIAWQIQEESKQLVKLLVLGVRADGSLLIIDSGLTQEDVDGLYKDFRLWIGQQLGNEMMGQSQ